MNISLVTIAFNNYGKFVNQWLTFVSEMEVKPTEVIVVLGKDHNCPDLGLIKNIYPEVKILEYKKRPSFGKLRNIGLKHTTSEWSWFVSVDDKVEPDAIPIFESALEKQDADYICAQWNTIGLGRPLTPHRSPLPIEMARYRLAGKGSGFVIPHSPFKRWLWEAHPYANTELPNYDFLLHCVLNGARFIKSDKPSTTYLRRDDSHARTRLLEIKKEARRQKKIMENGIVNYYKNRL